VLRVPALLISTDGNVPRVPFEHRVGEGWDIMQGYGMVIRTGCMKLNLDEIEIRETKTSLAKGSLRKLPRGTSDFPSVVGKSRHMCCMDEKAANIREACCDVEPELRKVQGKIGNRL
jgi:hypothetical protein